MQVQAAHDSSMGHDVSLRWALPVGGVKRGSLALLAAARASMRVGRGGLVRGFATAACTSLLAVR